MAAQTTPTHTSSPLDRHASPVADRGDRSGKATGALVVGIVGLLAAVLFAPLGWIFGIAAVLLGSVGRAETKHRGKVGHGQATAGWILGMVAFAIPTVLLFVGLALA
ncbi:MAG TPA: DUF4190 domain-containing protein [Solirubrobacteraceae bacterium]|jgi:hypothetical protein